MEKQGKLILVQGLAGSGKSHLIDWLRSDFCIEEGFALAEQSNIDKLVSALDGGKVCVVSERKYRSQRERSLFLATISGRTKSAHPVMLICFENDLESANHNCKHRSNKPEDPNGRGHILQNNRDTADYEIPGDAIVMKIQRIDALSPLLPAPTPPEPISTPG